MTEEGKRQLTSWIDAFVTSTSNTESPEILRKWTAIATLAAVLEQKVWIETSSALYPNLYTFLVAPPGVGKSRILNVARNLIVAAQEKPFIAPTSINAATLADQMKDSKREGIVDMQAFSYNSLCILVGEFGTFMSKYEDDIVSMLTDFYDVTPYGQRRRGNGGLKLEIERPLLNMIVGSTPATLMKFMPELAWEQGFTSRIIFVASNEKIIVDDFAQQGVRDDTELIADLKVINSLWGKFRVTDAYARAVTNWRELGEPPRPEHPRLTHYCSRRKTHLYRLSMIASIDRDNQLLLDVDCFNRAMGWLLEVEGEMHKVFAGASDASDHRAIEEIKHHVASYWLREQKAMSEFKLVNFIRQRVRAQAVQSIVAVMMGSGDLTLVREERGIRYFTVPNANLLGDATNQLPQ